MSKKETDILTKPPFTDWLVKAIFAAVVLSLFVWGLVIAAWETFAIAGWISVPILILCLVCGAILFLLSEKKDGIILLISAAVVFVLMLIAFLLAVLIRGL